MDRRTFVLLTGAASGAMLIPPAHGGTLGVKGRRPLGRLRFTLDDDRRWSLWYQGGDAPVPVIADAELGVWVGDRFVALGDLEDTAIGARRPPTGESLVVRGRGADVYVEAEFVTSESRDAPIASVTVSLYPDRTLPACRGVRFLQLPEPRILPEGAPLLALVNGYDARQDCRLATVGVAAADLTSHGALGLTRRHRGLGLSFDPGEPGEAKVHVRAGALEAVSDWLPARPLRPQGDSSTLRLCYDPDADGLVALAALFTPTSAVDRDRLAALAAPAGWRSGGALAAPVTEPTVLANLAFCAEHFGPRAFRFIQVDDGYQLAAGNWETNAAFPSGHRGLTERIHTRGFRAGLWMAPFAVAESSRVPAEHPEWLVRTGDGPVVFDERADWGGRVYGLDGAHPDVQRWLYALGRRAVREWGYDCLHADCLAWAAPDTAHHGGITRAEAFRRGLSALREGVGPEALLLCAGAPLQHAVGLVNGMRIGSDVDPSWGGIQTAARAAGLRSFYQRGAWINDPDAVLVGAPLTESEARTWASIVAVSGGAALCAGDLAALPPERVTILRRLFPVARVAGRPVGAMTPDRDVAPAVVTGELVLPLTGPWRFRTGDDASYAGREYVDDVWETMPALTPWEASGRPGYDGYAWYRTRFTLPAAPGQSPVLLELGKIDDADETYVNGALVGGCGGFPPAYRTERETYRRYAIPLALLNWGGENVLAVRVFDGGGRGGLWSGRRSRAPAVWVAAGAPQWWTVALVNWDDEPRELAVPLTDLGITAARLEAYDVWRDAPLAEVRQRLAATVEAHGTLTVALRPVAKHPQVIGTSRHIVQGAVDVADELWDPATRTLRARSTGLDAREYTVTLAAPPGLRPLECKAEPPCALNRLPSGHVVLRWAAGGDGRDIVWAVRFRAASRP